MCEQSERDGLLWVKSTNISAYNILANSPKKAVTEKNIFFLFFLLFSSCFRQMGATTPATGDTNNGTTTGSNSEEEMAVGWHQQHRLWQRWIIEPPKRCCWTPWMINILFICFILFNFLIYCFWDDPREQIKKFLFMNLLTCWRRLWSKRRGSTALVLKFNMCFVFVLSGSSKFLLCNENRGGEGTTKRVRFLCLHQACSRRTRGFEPQICGLTQAGNVRNMK